MVTKATRDVIDLAIRDVTDIKVSGNGNSSIDAVPIGTTTPDLGYFTNVKANSIEIADGGSLNVGSGVTISGLGSSLGTAAVGDTVYPGMLVKSTDAPARIFFNSGGTNITLTGTTAAAMFGDGLKEVISEESPKYGGMKEAALGLVVPPNVIIKSTDGSVFGNFTGSQLTVTSGTVSATLQSDGFTKIGPTTVATVKHIILDAVVGANVSDSELVMSSDNQLMVNLTGAPLAPSTGTTSADLLADGFTKVASTTPATGTLGVAVGPNEIVLSSDGKLMANLTGAPLTPTTGTTAADMSLDGFTNVAPDIPGLFKGNSGTVGFRPQDLFRINEQTVSVDTTIAANENATVAGPITVATGVTLTVLGNLSVV